MTFSAKPGICKLLACGLAAIAASVRAELVVIVHPDSGLEQLSKSQVVNIFLGSHRRLPNGVAATPIDMDVNTPERTQFYRSLVNRDANQMAAYWSRLVFSGSATPPAQARDWQEVVRTVASNPEAIGYVERKNIGSTRVSVVFSVP